PYHLVSPHAPPVLAVPDSGIRADRLRHGGYPPPGFSCRPYRPSTTGFSGPRAVRPTADGGERSQWRWRAPDRSPVQCSLSQVRQVLDADNGTIISRDGAYVLLVPAFGTWRYCLHPDSLSDRRGGLRPYGNPGDRPLPPAQDRLRNHLGGD